MERQKTQNSQYNIEKNSKVGGLPNMYYKAIVIRQRSTGEKINRSMEQNREPRSRLI